LAKLDAAAIFSDPPVMTNASLPTVRLLIVELLVLSVMVWKLAVLMVTSSVETGTAPELQSDFVDQLPSTLFFQKFVVTRRPSPASPSAVGV
jgi:hypothetical protein